MQKFQKNHATHRLFATMKTKLMGALALALLAIPPTVCAQVLDKIDVRRVGGEAEIVIRFLNQVQYQRHSPPSRGDNIRLYFQLVGLEGTEAKLVREVKTSPKSDAVGTVTIAYPDSTSAMTVTLPAVTSFRVRQGTDGRSISIFVPALPLPAQSSTVIAPVVAASPAPTVAAAAVTAPAAATAAITTTFVEAPAAVAAPVVTTKAAAPASPEALPTTPATAVAVPPPAVVVPVEAAAAPTPIVAAEPSADGTKAESPAPPTVVPSSAEVEAKAKVYLTQAQNALDQNQPGPAIEALNNLLNLPPNSLSQQGQETIGLARERSGEFGKAKAEYELYLKLYPKGDGVTRIRERLAKLPAASATETAASESARRTVEDTGWKLYGGLSQYRYHGESSTRTDPLRLTLDQQAAVAAGTITPAQLAAQQANANQVTRSVQNTLVSNLDATEERRTATTDDKFVVRDVLDTNYQADASQGQARSHSRMSTAYYERSDRDRAYMLRLGRQSGTGGGVLGQFNGASASYNYSPQVRLSGVAGSMYEYGSPYSKQVFGGTVDLQPSQSRQWGGNVFFVEQRYDGKTDRAAVGGEARYFDATRSAFAMLDYDIVFQALNTAMMQLNLQGDSATNYYVTIDHRRSPVLLLTSALDSNTRSLSQLLTVVSEKQIRADIKRMTPFSNSFAVGFTRPMSERWQIGSDYRVSNLSSTTDTVSLPADATAAPGTPYRAAQPGAANTHAVSAQAIGNNLLWKNDMVVVNGSYYYAKKTTAPYTAESLSINHVAVPDDKWRFDSALRFYWQTTDPTSSEPMTKKDTRITPSLRASYRLRNNLNFEVEGNIEFDRSSETSTSGATKSTVKFIYAGYRWDWL